MTITKEQIEQAKHDFENESELYWHKDTKDTIQFAIRLAHKVMSEPSNEVLLLGFNTYQDVFGSYLTRMEKAFEAMINAAIEEVGDE